MSLSVSDVSVSFGGNHVLRGVDLDLTERFTGLVGPNGAGKTTLFNVVSGYVRPSSGSIRIGGTDVTGWPQTRIARLGVGRTFQTPRLIGDLTVLDNVLLGLDGHRSLRRQVLDAALPASSAVSRDTATAVVRQFALGDVLGREAGSLPLGSQKIVEVCRALVPNPSLLLLDEPAAGLGRRDVDQLVAPLREWAAEHGTAVLIIEHDLELVTDLCEDIAVLHLGAILARGTPAECMRRADVIEAYLGASVAAGV
jgi:branched-chain amino acid transport system ATP-binding protein